LPGFFIAQAVLMKTLSLLIKNEPALTSGAVRFARATAATTTRVDCVFFFGKGVLHATGDNKQFWSSWARSTGTRLVLCSASAETCGLLGDDDFSVEGLGELIATGLNSHRVVSFG